jgi:hypothetical protein
MTDPRFHLCSACFDAWAPGGQHYCTECAPKQPRPAPIPLYGSLPPSDPTPE